MPPRVALAQLVDLCYSCMADVHDHADVDDDVGVDDTGP